MEGYTKIRQIGKGNMGTCHLAKSPTGDIVVLKTVTMWKMNRKEKAKAEQEAKLLKSVRHPNIVKYVHSWVTRSDDLMIAMEYVAKGDLCKYIETNKSKGLMPETKALDWFIQIALSVNHTGRKHILHRDLKSQNILISDDNVLKLADFGISRSINATWEQAHTFVGTPYYLAPELVMQQPYNIQVDAWALGVVLCEMLTMTHPFTGHDMKSLCNNIVKGVYKKPSTQYSAEIRSLVSKLLQRDPKQRMTVSQALAAPIVQSRLNKWLTQDKVMPAAYVAELVSEGCLEDVVPRELLSVATAKQEGLKSGDISDKDAQEAASNKHKEQKREMERILEDAQQRRASERERIMKDFSNLKASPRGLNRPDPISHTPSAASPGPSPTNAGGRRPSMPSPHGRAPSPANRAPSPHNRAPSPMGRAPSPPSAAAARGRRPSLPAVPSPTNAVRRPTPEGRAGGRASPSPPAPAARRNSGASRFPPVHGAGAYPGHAQAQAATPAYPVATPRDLLAEKRRILGLMEKQNNAAAAENHRRRASGWGAQRPW